MNEKNSQKLTNDNQETGKLIKESLKIVDELATIDLEEIIGTTVDVNEYEKLEALLENAKKLKKHRLWKLK